MKTRMIHILLLAVLMPVRGTLAQETVLLTDSAASAPGNSKSEESSGFDFFATDELLEMTLGFNFREFLKTRNNPENIDAILTVKMKNGKSVTQPIKIKARGEMRRTICYYPPIMLKFSSSKNDTVTIREKGSLKLVTPCNQTRLYENYVLKEYLAYKLYNQVTPYSFKTRLVKVNYLDTEKPKNTYTAYGFVIENEKDMAARNDAALVDVKIISDNQMNAQDMARVAVFNYMIGNTDWWLPNQHNVKILSSRKELTGKGIPVTYDFDYSGFVNAEYSAPTVNIPIKDVTERYYMGMCYNDEEINPVIGEFLELKDQFINTIEDFDLLPNGDKKRVESYISSFYRANKTNYVLISDLNRTCRRFE